MKTPYIVAVFGHNRLVRQEASDGARFVVEVCSQDALGDPRWNPVDVVTLTSDPAWLYQFLVGIDPEDLKNE